MTNWSQDFSVKSNARRAAKAAKLDPSTVITVVRGGIKFYRYPLEAEAPKAAPKKPAKAKASTDTMADKMARRRAGTRKGMATKAAKKAKTTKARALTKSDGAATSAIERLRASVTADGAKPSTKTDRGLKFTAVAALLRRTQGASITEVCTVTGWQPHSARARISVDVSKLLTKGEEIVRLRQDGVSQYFIKPSKQLELPGVTKDAA